MIKIFKKNEKIEKKKGCENNEFNRSKNNRER